MKKQLILLLSIILFTSCVSFDRMMRVSPFTSDDKTPSAERINLWPLFHQDGEKNSLLWPICDWDAHGYAIRPLLNKDDNDYSILFPLSAWNAVNKDGWVGLCYWEEDRFGLFPIFYFGDDFTHIGPAWWTHSDKPRSFGLFPLMGKIEDDLMHIGPVWWTDKNGEGLFPIYYHKKDDKSWLFPIYGIHKYSNKQRYNLGLGIISSLSVYKNGGHRFWLAPLYYSSSSAKKDEKTRLILPLYYSNKDKYSTHSTLLPIYHWQKDADSKLLLTPLGGRGWNNDGTTTMTNILGPFYHRSIAGDETTTAFLWPLFWQQESPILKEWYIFPVAHYRRNSTEKTLGFLANMLKTRNGKQKLRRFAPIFSYSEQRSVESLWDYLSLVSINKNSAYKRFAIGSFLGLVKTYKKYRNNLKVKKISLLTILHKAQREYTTIYSRHYPLHDKLLSSTQKTLFPFYFSTKKKIKELPHDFFAEDDYSFITRWLYKDEQFKIKNSEKIIEIISQKGYKPATSSEDDIIAELIEVHKDNGKINTHLDITIPLLFSLEKQNETKEWSMLLNSVSYKKDGKRSKFTILHYLYRRDQDGERIDRDFFPFITWNSGGNRSRFSLFWHLFNMEKHDGKRSGHLLFFPWGK